MPRKHSITRSARTVSVLLLQLLATNVAFAAPFGRQNSCSWDVEIINGWTSEVTHYAPTRPKEKLVLVKILDGQKTTQANCSFGIVRAEKSIREVVEAICYPTEGWMGAATKAFPDTKTSLYLIGKGQDGSTTTIVIGCH